MRKRRSLLLRDSMAAPWVVLAVVVLFVVSYMAISRGSSDPYGTFHLSLNRRPGQIGLPTTEWLNMGYWEDTEVFREACEALALRLCSSARLTTGGRVLDVGHGSGDSLLLHLSHPSVPRPKLLFGITSLPSHHARAQQRVSFLLSDTSGLRDQTEVVLLPGDAVWRHPSPSHPFSDKQEAQFDTILALDCAYHFRTRTLFLQQSFERLAPGGHIALADICFAEEPSTFTTTLVSRVLGIMPRENMISRDAYIQDMEKLGYTDVSLEDITRSVFPGFRRYLKTQGLVWTVFASAIGGLESLGARFVIVSATKPLP
ncbi:S-adenosyl-L-methionine-dependent methyltransferase [Auriscalpium vulgare]|uniref:S-adenosyl-L-methionine-dependent methyltransferase n=1 Tax=Auriscalpium vulgare TaxID=40419 RepID=A0ACB8S5C6_9AGAM|nr:S-adenosyl-L-methionine-dependent methyltransferase [Auriscalpium vulgare]